MTVDQLITAILSDFPNPIPNTVDTLKTGNPSTEVTGIVTTFLASMDILKQAVDLGANVVITHEPIFYNHRDETDWLQDDPVYQAKRRLIDEHGLCIFRFHDYWHRFKPDGILTGMVAVLGWSENQETPGAKRFSIPETAFSDLVSNVKAKLGPSTVRVTGDPRLACKTVVHLAGTTPGQHQIAALSEGADVVMVGETNEWETCEYVRDATSIGDPKGLIVLGHGYSEEAGMAYLVEWLQERIGTDIPIRHIPTGDPFRFA